MSNPLLMVDHKLLNMDGMMQRAIECLSEYMTHPQATPTQKHNGSAALGALVGARDLIKTEPQPTRKPRQRITNIVPLPPSVQ